MPLRDLSARILTNGQPQLLLEGRDRSVEVMVADTPALLKRVYRLRYDVYCLEKKFEDPGMQIAGFEQDRFDDHSVHVLMVDRKDGTERGAVRLVLPNDEVSLPVCAVSDAFVAAANDGEFPLDATAEVSRFLRASDPVGCRRRDAMETLALMAGVVRMSFERGISHLAALVTAPMLRHLQCFGFAFTPVGDAIDYHGRRYACILDLASELGSLAKERPEIWRVLTVGGHFYPRAAPVL